MDNNHHTCGEDHLRYNISKEQKLLNRNFYQVCHNSYPPFLHLFHTYDDVEVLLIVQYVVCVWIVTLSDDHVSMYSVFQEQESVDGSPVEGSPVGSRQLLWGHGNIQVRRLTSLVYSIQIERIVLLLWMFGLPGMKR